MAYTRPAPVALTPTVERRGFESERDLQLEQMRRDPRLMAQALMMLGLPDPSAPLGTVPAVPAAAAPPTGYTPQQALSIARQELTNLYYGWANASDEEIVEHVKQDPTLFVDNDAIRSALLGGQQQTLANERLEFGQQTALSQLLANPRGPAAPGAGTGTGSPIPLRATPQDVAKYLQGTKEVQDYFNRVGLTADQTKRSGADFSFVWGRHMPVADTLQDLQTNPQGRQMGLTSGLASFSGQDEPDFWSDFQRALPQGEAYGPTRIS